MPALASRSEPCFANATRLLSLLGMVLIVAIGCPAEVAGVASAPSQLLDDFEDGDRLSYVTRIAAEHCTVGWLLLRPGILVLDGREHTVSVQFPGPPLSLPTAAAVPGLLFENQCGRIIVRDVLPDSPAAAAGAEVGDWVRRIDGREAITVPVASLNTRGSRGGLGEIEVARVGERIVIRF